MIKIHSSSSQPPTDGESGEVSQSTKHFLETFSAKQRCRRSRGRWGLVLKLDKKKKTTQN